MIFTAYCNGLDASKTVEVYSAAINEYSILGNGFPDAEGKYGEEPDQEVESNRYITYMPSYTEEHIATKHFVNVSKIFKLRRIHD